MAPRFSYEVTINEAADGTATASVNGTDFPSLEVWQYGGPTGEPQLLYYYDEEDQGPSDLLPEELQAIRDALQFIIRSHDPATLRITS